MVLDMNDPDTKAEVEALIAAQTKALKEQNEKVIGEKRKAAERLEALQKQYEGIDPDAVKRIMASAEQDDEAKLLSTGKLDDVIKMRLDKIQRDLNAKIAGQEQQTAKERERADAAEARYKTTLIKNALRDAASRAGVRAAAIEDVLARANGLFTLDDEGEVIRRDRDGDLVLQDGKPYSPKDFMTELKEKAPHFWPESKGAGLTGNTSGLGKDAQQELTRAAAKGDMTAYRKARKNT